MAKAPVEVDAAPREFWYAEPSRPALWRDSTHVYRVTAVPEARGCGRRRWTLWHLRFPNGGTEDYDGRYEGTWRRLFETEAGAWLQLAAWQRERVERLYAELAEHETELAELEQLARFKAREAAEKEHRDG